MENITNLHIIEQWRLGQNRLRTEHTSIGLHTGRKPNER